MEAKPFSSLYLLCSLQARVAVDYERKIEEMIAHLLNFKHAESWGSYPEGYGSQ